VIKSKCAEVRESMQVFKGIEWIGKSKTRENRNKQRGWGGGSVPPPQKMNIKTFGKCARKNRRKAEGHSMAFKRGTQKVKLATLRRKYFKKEEPSYIYFERCGRGAIAEWGGPHKKRRKMPSWK